MTDEKDEEAIDILANCIDDYVIGEYCVGKHCIDENMCKDKDCPFHTAIETVLNLIQTQQEEIERLKQTELKAKGGAIKVTLEGLLEIETKMLKLEEKIEKKDKRLNRQFKLLQKRDKELEKKNKIIDEMATYIGKIDESEDLCNDNICHEGNNCNKCIKEYFINKVEKEKRLKEG